MVVVALNSSKCTHLSTTQWPLSGAKNIEMWAMLLTRHVGKGVRGECGIGQKAKEIQLEVPGYCLYEPPMSWRERRQETKRQNYQNLLQITLLFLWWQGQIIIHFHRFGSFNNMTIPAHQWLILKLKPKMTTNIHIMPAPTMTPRTKLQVQCTMTVRLSIFWRCIFWWGGLWCWSWWPGRTTYQQWVRMTFQAAKKSQTWRI